MLVEAKRLQVATTPKATDIAQAVGNSALSILSAVWRQRYVLLAGVVLGLALGVAYLAQAIPGYTSTTTILIDSRKVGVTGIPALDSAMAFDSGVVDSQVQILLSDKLAGIVADRLGLADNVAFLNPPQSPLGRAFGAVVSTIGRGYDALVGTPPMGELMSLPLEVRRQVAVGKLRGNLKVTRVGRTYVLNVDYSDTDRVMARDIAAAYGQAYLADQIDSRIEIARNASAWMENRIRELRARADAADKAAEDYRVRNNLTAASGRLINEQALTEAMGQLSAARSEATAARAKYDRLKQIIDSRDYAATVVDSLASPIVGQLRTKYLQASKTNSEITAKVGADHYAADAARKEMAEYSRLIFEELTRMLQSYESDVRISTDKVATIERSVAGMRTLNASDSDAQRRLRSLEQEAATYNGLHNTMLQKFQETAQQQSFPVTDAGILSYAALPIRPSSPNTLIVLIASVILGGAFGAGLAALREVRDSGFRTSAQVREWLGLDFAGYIPKLPKNTFSIRRAPKSRGDGSGGERMITTLQPSLDYVRTNPLSRYAESVRALKVALDVKSNLRRPVVVGMVSVQPDEGKSTVAKNLASLLAAQGERVLLIDGDLRNPHLTRCLAPGALHGLIEVSAKTQTLDSVTYADPHSSLSFLPGATHKRFDASGDLLGSRGMADTMREACDKYDIIVLDLPPAGLLVDAAAAASLVDTYFLIVEWGRTRREAVRDLLVAHPELAEKINGVALTKVDMQKLKTFGAYGGYGYYTRYGARYYGDAKA